MIEIPILNSKVPEYVKTLRDQSLTVHGGRLFNCLPYEIRGWTGSKETFKTMLDNFLSDIPDNPVSPGLIPTPVCRTNCRNSNSILAWARFLNTGGRRPIPVDPNEILADEILADDST